jgi:phage/plasmid-like protein (TIGR03299 family)
MSHEIHNSKFASFRVPAWHKLGEVFTEPINAIAAADKLGLPVIDTGKVYLADGSVIPGFKAITGKEEGKDLQVFSIVSNEYQEIAHRDFIEAWDRATQSAPVETIGLLGKGERLFVSSVLPSFEVKGDECSNYLLAFNPLNGIQAATARITPVRVVCANTLAQSEVNYKDQFRVIHTTAAAKDIEAWLKRVWNLAVDQTATVREAFEILAGKSIGDEQFKDVLKAVYPINNQADTTSLQGGLSDEFTAYIKRQQAHRDKVLSLFQGEAVGQTKAFVGTAWGAWNSIVEYEDYAKSRRQAASVLVGAGASRKNLAFRQLITL